MQSLTSNPLNIRVYSDGKDKNSTQSSFSFAVSVVTLTLYCGWLHVFLLLFLSCAFSRVATAVLLVILSTLLLPRKPVLWRAFNESWVFRTWREYFSFSYLFEENLDPNKSYVFVEFPHGVFPMGPLLAGTLVNVMFPDFKIFSLAASSVFTIPGWCHFSTWMGSVPATSGNFRKLLSKGSVAVIVGGIAEMFMGSKTEESIMLKTRKGFVRIAVEEGIDGGIVPVYHFGNSQILSFWPQSNATLSRKLRAALAIMYGRWGLPTPRPEPIYMVTGRPIPVNKMAKTDSGYEAEVDRVHALVISELQALYDRHKTEFGWKDRPLVIQ